MLSLTDASEHDPYLKPGVFIIGNHADELTPWLPVISTLRSASGYLSIPCCAWAFDAKYEPSTVAFSVPSPDFVDALNLGGNGSNSSSYSMYRIWLASLSLPCGWEVECENLRIPSTLNWAIVGRKRSSNTTPDEAEERAREIVSNVWERGMFKTRRPESRAGGH
jgi:tRNASer (uridine44-2'-O)-methyltransferase